MLKLRPDLGSYLYEHPQEKKKVLQKELALSIGQFFLAKETEGIEVSVIMPFPLVGKGEVYCFTLRFPLETDFDGLKQMLESGFLHFKITGLCKNYKSQTGEKYRPLCVVLVDSTEENLKSEDF